MKSYPGTLMCSLATVYHRAQSQIIKCVLSDLVKVPPVCREYNELNITHSQDGFPESQWKFSLSLLYPMTYELIL